MTSIIMLILRFGATQNEPGRLRERVNPNKKCLASIVGVRTSRNRLTEQLLFFRL